MISNVFGLQGNPIAATWQNLTAATTGAPLPTPAASTSSRETVPSRCELWSRLKNGNKSEPQQGQRWRTQCTCSRETLRKVMPLRAPQSKAVFKTQAGIDHEMSTITSTISPSNPT